MRSLRRLWIGGLALLAMPGIALAQAPSPTQSGVIVAHADAHRRLPATVSDVSLEIEARARTITDTSAQLATRSQTLLDYLRGEHAERLRTEQVGVDPETAQATGQPVRVTGYVGRARVSFRTTPDRAPVLLAGCLDHGANALLRSGSSPPEAEVAAARRELAAEAARDALAQAEIVAKALGEHVTGVERAEIDPLTSGPVRPMMGAMALKSSAPVAMEAGESDITVGITLTARITPEAP